MDLTEALGNTNRHPWEISRTKRLIQQCIRLIENVDVDELRICDIGSGDGYFDSQLISSLNARGVKSILHAVDCNYQNLEIISDHIQLHNDISTVENNQMDLIIMMDVLEHIVDDSNFINKVVRLLKEDGTILITVPAHANLFSTHDMSLKHYRRYDFAKFELLMHDSQLNVDKCHFFYSSLFIIRWLQVKLRKRGMNIRDNSIALWKYSDKNLITIILTGILDFDFLINVILNRIGINIPGLSIICVAKK